MEKGPRLCRVCFSKEGKTTFQHLPKFSQIQLYLIFGIMIVELKEHPPVLICKKCRAALENAAQLREIAIEADKFFRKQTKDVEEKLWKSESDKMPIEVTIKTELWQHELVKVEPPIFNPASVDNICENKTSETDDFDEIFQDDAIDDEDWTTKAGDNVNHESDEFSVPEEPPEPKKSKRKKTKEQRRAENTKFKCDCGRGFSSRKRLAEHVQLKHTEIPIEDWIPCPMMDCGKKFKIQSSVDMHVRHRHNSEEGRKKVACLFCGKLLVKSALKLHEERHLRQNDPKAKSFHCDICGRTFAERQYILLHVERIHLKLRKFKCKYCPAAFVHGTLLEFHVRQHLNIRPNKCRYCEKTFMRQSCVKIHERTHTGERPYCCRFCGRTFVHHSDHRRHELRHTGGIPKKEFDLKLAKGLVAPIELPGYN